VKLSPLILVLITLAIVAGVIGVFLILQPVQAPVSESGTSTPTSTETTPVQQSQTTSKTSTSMEEVNIKGPWYGTYTSQHGTGRWAARIKKVGDKYVGILTLTSPYQVKAMGVQIKLVSNQITFGWAGGATFTGTVSGDAMSGTWEAPGGVDSGTWNGQRGETDITPEWPTETSSSITTTITETTTTTLTTTTAETQSTTTTSTETTTTTTLSLPNDVMNTVNNDVLNVLAQVYGDASLLGHSIVGDQYLMAYAIPVNVTDPYNEGQAVLSLMLDKGYQQINFITSSEGYLVIVSKIFNGVTYNIAITGSIGSNEIAVTIYVA